MIDPTPRPQVVRQYRLSCGCVFWPLVTIGVLWLCGFLG